MKVMLTFLSCLVAASSMAALPRVVVMDFEAETGVTEKNELLGGMTAEELVKKGAYLLNAELVSSEMFSVVDRRDFKAKMASDNEEVTPSYIHAAQQLRADAVIRGVLMSFSVGSQVQSQAGKTAEWVTFGMTVMLQVQDPLDGSVINVAEGKSHFQLRQTKAQKTTMSEDDILQMFRDAIRQASQDTLNALETRLKKLAERERATLTVRATEDPALVKSTACWWARRRWNR